MKNKRPVSKFKVIAYFMLGFTGLGFLAFVGIQEFSYFVFSNRGFNWHNVRVGLGLPLVYALMAVVGSRLFLRECERRIKSNEREISWFSRFIQRYYWFSNISFVFSIVFLMSFMESVYSFAAGTYSEAIIEWDVFDILRLIGLLILLMGSYVAFLRFGIELSNINCNESLHDKLHNSEKRRIKAIFKDYSVVAEGMVVIIGILSTVIFYMFGFFNNIAITVVYILFAFLAGAFYQFEHLTKIRDRKISEAEREVIFYERSGGDLIKNLSHSMRTPLASISVAAKELKKHQLEDGLAMHLDILLRNVKRLGSLTGKILEDAESRQKPHVVNFDSVALHSFIKVVSQKYSHAFEERNLTLVMQTFNREQGLESSDSPDKEKKQFIVSADPDLLENSLENLFENVCKYAICGTRVFAEVWSIGNVRIFSLKNVANPSTIASPKDIMQPYSKGDPSRNTLGHGLGTAIIKRNMNGVGEFVINSNFNMFEAYLIFNADIENMMKLPNKVDEVNELLGKPRPTHKCNWDSSHQIPYSVAEFSWWKRLLWYRSRNFQNLFYKSSSDDDRVSSVSELFHEANTDIYKDIEMYHSLYVNDELNFSEEINSWINWYERTTMCNYYEKLFLSLEGDFHIAVVKEGLFRVLDILLNNAKKHALQDTDIHIGLTTHDNHLAVLSIKNISKTPIDMPDYEFIRHIFDVDKLRAMSVNPNIHLSGGLTNALYLVKLMRGELDVFVDSDMFTVEVVFKRLKPDYSDYGGPPPPF